MSNEERVVSDEERGPSDTSDTTMTAPVPKFYDCVSGGTTYTFEIENLPNSHNPDPMNPNPAPVTGAPIAMVQFLHLMMYRISPAPATNQEIEECRGFRALAQNFWTTHYEGIRQAFAQKDKDGNVTQTFPTQPTIPTADMVDFPSSIETCAVRCINTLRASSLTDVGHRAGDVKPSPCCTIVVMKDLNTNQLIGISGGVSLHYET